MKKNKINQYMKKRNLIKYKNLRDMYENKKAEIEMSRQY
jgi:hypothetical protein